MWTRIRSGGCCKLAGPLRGESTGTPDARAKPPQGPSPSSAPSNRQPHIAQLQGLKPQAQELIAEARAKLPFDVGAVEVDVADALVTVAAEGLSEEEHAKVLVGHPLLRPMPTDLEACPWPKAIARGRSNAHGEPEGACMCSLVCLRGRPVAALIVGTTKDAAFGDDDCARLVQVCTPTLPAQAFSRLRSVDGRCQLETAVAPPHDGMHRRCPTARLVGYSEGIQRVREAATLASLSAHPVLLVGEIGVGKELIATRIHRESTRGDRELIIVHCTALSPSTAEAELFGRARGSPDERLGLLELAHLGTVYFDEVGELPLEIQAKLLRAIEVGQIRRVGATREIRVDVRIIAATSRDLVKEVALGRFRGDLLERLTNLTIHAPALRDHSEDIPDLVRQFAACAGCELDAGRVEVSASALAALRQMEWPGNVRELRSTIERAARRAAGATPCAEVKIELEHLPLQGSEGASSVSTSIAPASRVLALGLQEAMREQEQGLIRSTLATEGGCWRQTAQRLRTPRSNLSRHARRLSVL